MANLQVAQKQLGEVFIMGIEGLELSEDSTQFISQARIGGVILFTRNYESPAQVSELINQIQECRNDLPLWICVDQEGGKVQRFKDPFTILPSAAVMGASPSPKAVFEASVVQASELKAIGANVNFAPVADINTNPKNPIIGNRSYGSTEEKVTQAVTAVVRGHLTHGVQACVKHFPGHGDTTKDSHLELPRVDTPLNILKEREFKPFIKAVKSRCSMIMSAHILNPHIDPEFPATLSRKTLTDILREEFRYSRIIISDDMEMKAITDHYGETDAPRMALQAGCDLLIYRSEAMARRVYASLSKDLEKGKLDPETVMQSVERSRALKQEFLMPYSPVSITDLNKKIGIPENKAKMEVFESGK